MVLVFSAVSNAKRTRTRGMENRMKRFPSLFWVAAAPTRAFSSCALAGNFPHALSGWKRGLFFKAPGIPPDIPPLARPAPKRRPSARRTAL